MNRANKKTHHEVVKKHRKPKFLVKPKQILIKRRNSYPGFIPVKIYAFSSEVCFNVKLNNKIKNDKNDNNEDGFQLFTPRRKMYSIGSIGRNKEYRE